MIERGGILFEPLRLHCDFVSGFSNLRDHAQCDRRIQIAVERIEHALLCSGEDLGLRGKLLRSVERRALRRLPASDRTSRVIYKYSARRSASSTPGKRTRPLIFFFHVERERSAVVRAE